MIYSLSLDDLLVLQVSFKHLVYLIDIERRCLYI